MAKTAKIALIDSHALIHRAYHALPPMTTKTGQPTNAVYGFTTMLLKTFEALKPTHVAAAFDMKGPTWRVKELASYKAHRVAAPDDLKSQFDVVRRVVRAFNIPVLELSGFEADDIIGTLVKKLGDSVQKIIVTGDMDALQLVDGTTTVFTLRRGVTDTIVYDAAAVTAKYGFEPKLLVEYKGLRGDPSDNIPGVKGIGDKTASELVATYKTIENIYKHLGKLSPRVQKQLVGQKEQALLCRRLATIRTDVPLEFSLDDARLDDYDSEKVRQIFTELEFKSLVQRLPKINEQLQPGANAAKHQELLSAELPKQYHLVDTPAARAELKKTLATQAVIAVDTETDFLDARLAPIIGLSLATRIGKNIEAWYVPVNRDSVKEWQDILEDENIQKVGHNLKYDWEVLAQSGLRLGPIAFDSMIGSYLLNPGGRQHGLATVALQEFDRPMIPITELIGSGKEQKPMSTVPLSALARYSAEDAELSFLLYEKLAPRIQNEGLQRILTEFELPLIPVLGTIELNGITLDTADLKKLNTKVTARLKKLKSKIWEQAGGEFNVNSTQQLREVLFTKLNLPTVGISRTQTGFSTAADELAKLQGQHPIIKLLEEYRELSKLQNTYIATLPSLVDTKTKRLYASFNQTVAATGRLSSSDPNLQNIPVRTEIGQEIRAAFIAPRGSVLVKADYSQLELRLAAHLAQDETMIDAFRHGADIHQATAAWVYGIEPKDVAPEQRRVAKTLNFGVLYGMGPRAFARESGLSVERAQSFIERYKERYGGLTRFYEATLDHAKAMGYVATMFGRKRYVPEINSSNPQIRAQAERIAFNFPMQGTEADILKKAMILLQQLIESHYPAAKFVLTVHDELVVETPTKIAESFARDMKKTMETVVTLDVPLDVEVAIGKNWRDVKAVT